ncbi:MAG: S8 family serine peptidase, partial [Acidobacteriota bacterium]|nr:S8 family serine peptidase [Acidobacteriota bacterium]
MSHKSAITEGPSKRLASSILSWTLVLTLILVAGAFSPVMAKSDKHISDAVSAQAQSGELLRLMVAYDDRPGNLERKQIKALGGKVLRQYKKMNRMAVELTADAAAVLAEQPGVAWVTLDHKVQANMDVAKDLAGVTEAIKAPSGYDGAGVTVAVLDTGLDMHLDIQDQKVFMVDALQNFHIGGTFDQSGHGTHIAGIIAGNGYDSDGFYTGVAPSASILSVRVLDRSGAGYASDVIAGIDWVLEHKDTYNIRVANFSLGHSVRESIDTDPLVAAVEQLWDAGVVVVCSAGNNGRDGYFTITSPGNSPKVITVGSL